VRPRISALLSFASAALAACGGTSVAPTAPTAVTDGPPAASEPRYDYRDQDVTISARALTLEGTLSVPEADRALPAIVLVHGSGALGRDERLPGQLGVQFGFEVAVFDDLTDAFARAGYVVLRYDKRSCNAETGCDNSYPDDADFFFDDYIGDARAAIDWLANRREVDPANIFVVGHSQGGAFVPELMLDEPRLRAGVMLAAPFRSIDELFDYQAEYVLRRLLQHQMHRMVIGVRLRELQEITAGLKKLRVGRWDKSDIADTPVSFWQAWMELSDAIPAVITRLDRPLFALSGAIDTNVPPSETELWRTALSKISPDPGHRVSVVPCVTHALNCVAPNAAGREEPGRNVHGAIVEEVVAFLRETAQ
jgi:pimeloyl-ACP methyl ester carboxylesterase